MTTYFHDSKSGEQYRDRRWRKEFGMLKLQKSLGFLVSLVLVTSLFSSALPYTKNGMLKAQHILVQMAASNPNQTVSVIIQKVNQTTSAEGQVAALGGQVTQDLSIINAFSAEMTTG